MSADNYGYVAKHPETEAWHVLMGFASDTSDEANARCEDDGPLFSLSRHSTEGEAFDAAFNDYFEYGVDSGPWPADRVT